jgi:two-component system, NtrC family, sensor histidine kinase KinB
MRSLRTQLLISHMLLVLLLAIVMSSAIASLFSLSNSFERIYSHNFDAIVAATDCETAFADQATMLEMANEGKFDSAEALDRKSREMLESGLLRMENVSRSRREVELAQQLRAGSQQYLVLARAAIAAAHTSGFDELRTRTDRELIPRLARLRNYAIEVARLNEREVIEEDQKVRAQIELAANRSLLFTAASVVLAILLALRMVRMALKPLAILARYADTVATGDLTQKIEMPRKDEVGALADSFNTMVSKLAEVRSAEKRRLQRAEQMTDAALEHLYDPVIVTDAKGRISYLNRAAEGLFGPVEAPRRIDVDTHVTDLRIVRAIQKAISGRQVSASEDEKALVPIRVGDSERIYRLRVAPMTSREGNLLGAVAIMEDITHLRVVDQIKNEFIGVASHELRTPVTSLLLSVQLLEEGAVGELTEPQKEVVSAQRADLERLEKLMRELLDVSRLESGSNPPRFVLSTPEELIGSPVAGVRPEAKRKGVSLVVDATANGGQLRADRSQLGRVITNLLANAVRHTEPGGTVTIRALPFPDEVTFEVEDTGEGIPPEYLKRIFERFVQVPGATQGGAGLGLSIAQSIVRAHGGQMNVRSELGKGSVFSFTVPRDPSAAGGENTV